MHSEHRGHTGLYPAAAGDGVARRREGGRRPPALRRPLRYRLRDRGGSSDEGDRRAVQRDPRPQVQEDTVHHRRRVPCRRVLRPLQGGRALRVGLRRVRRGQLEEGGGCPDRILPTPASPTPPLSSIALRVPGRLVLLMARATTSLTPRPHHATTTAAASTAALTPPSDRACRARISP